MLLRFSTLLAFLFMNDFFSMPPSATSLDNTVTGVLFGNSNIQFKDEGNNRGTPSSVRNVDFVGAGVEATLKVIHYEFLYKQAHKVLWRLPILHLLILVTMWV